MPYDDDQNRVLYDDPFSTGTVTEQHEELVIYPGTPEYQEMLQRGYFPSSRETIKNVGGEPIKVIQSLFTIDPLGRKVPLNYMSGISWSGYPVPSDRFGSCLNPFKRHAEHRAICLGIDGEVTEKGNMLCTDCIEWQDKQILLSRLLLFGLIWRPQIY